MRIHVYTPSGQLKEIIDGALPLIKWEWKATVVKGPDGKSYLDRHKFYRNQRVNNAALINIFSYRDSESESTKSFNMLLFSNGTFTMVDGVNTDIYNNRHIGRDITKNQTCISNYELVKERILDFIVKQKKSK